MRVSPRFAVILLLVSALVLFTGICYGIPIGLKSGAYDPDVSGPAVPNQLVYGTTASDSSDFFIVQFDSPITPGMRESLVARGARILRYLPMYAYIVKMSGADCQQLMNEEVLYHVEVFQPSYKISPGLHAFVPLLGGEQPDTPTVQLTIQVFAGEDCDAVSKTIADAGFSTRELAISTRPSGGKIRLSVASSDAGDLIIFASKVKSVEWIEEWVPFELNNHESRWIIQSYQEDYTPVWDHGVDGTGQLVAIGDTGVDADMCYFYDSAEGLPDDTINHDQRKIVVYYDMAGNGDWDGHDHGSHVACTVAGDNSANLNEPDYDDGIAYNAKLVFLDVGYGESLWGIPNDLNDYFIIAFDAGARIHSNSWGASTGGSYTSDCQACDEFMWNHPDFLALFSNGNDGAYGSNTVGAPATAKNVLSSGATENYYPTSYDPENMAYFSSRGPCDDGRLKPTVGAPGHYVVSANNDFNISSYNCDTRTMSGTSMSCPTHAGAVALVRQYFVDGYYPTGEPQPYNGFEPSAALMKAVMVNSGREMTGNAGGSIPNQTQGWGRTTLDDTLYFRGDDRPLWVRDDRDGLETDQSMTYRVFVQVERLEVTLVWSDYPAATYANPCLVNDLDLEVTYQGSTYLGNVYSGGQSTTGGSPDRLNPVECVQLNDPAPGAYTVTVRAHNVPNGPQPFALVISGVSGDTGGTANWPMFGHDARHAGRTPSCTFDFSPFVKWSYTVADSSDSFPVEGTDGTIYFMADDGNLLAFDHDGNLKWSYSVGSPSMSSPAVAPDGLVVVGDSGGLVTAVNPDGSLAWTRAVGHAVSYPATVDQTGNTCLSTMGNTVVVLSPTGSTIATFATHGLPKSPAMADDYAYVGTSTGELYELDMRQGTSHVLASGLGDVTNSPTVDDENSIYVGNAAGLFYKVASDGTIAWSYSAGDRIESSTAIATDGTVVFGCHANKVIALGSDGTLKWSYDTGDRVSSSPAMDCNRNVAVACRNGALYHLDREGNLNWSLDLGGDIISSPAIAQNKRIVISNGSEVLCIARDTSAPVLSDDGFSPSEGNTDADFAFSVHYQDADGDAPEAIYVNISGTDYDLTLDSGEAWDGVYSAQTTLSGGEHQIFYYAEDGYGGSGRVPEGGTKPGPVVNYDPELTDGSVTPATGWPSTEFLYSVHYYDTEGESPSVPWVYIDGAPSTMTLDSGDPADGVYSYSAYLSGGYHDYFFYFEDDDGASVRLPISGIYDGPTVTDEYEPDDTCEEASPISDDGSHQSHMLVPEGDYDWVEFEAHLGFTYVAQTHGDTDTYMRLIAPNCTTEIDADDGSGEDQNALIEWTCDSPGTYHLRVNGYSYFTTGEYELELLQTGHAPVLYDQEFDPETGKVSTEFEFRVHYYDFGGGEPAFSMIYVDSYDSPSTMTLKSGAPADGVYSYSTSLGEGEHSYCLYFENADGQGAYAPLSGAFEGPMVVDEYEPDGTCEEAATISTMGRAQSRSLLPYGDRDWVEFHAELSGVYTAETTGTTDTYMYLYMSDCETILARDDESGTGHNAKMTWTCPSTGTYYLMIEGFHESDVGNYELSVRLTNYAPELSEPTIDPECGEVGGDFTFSVQYHDRSGDAPATMVVYVDNSPEVMWLTSGDAWDGVYEYEATGLASGPHTHRFYFLDTGGAVALLPETGCFHGPFVSDEYEDDDSCPAASPIEVGSGQFHTFCPEGDIDWVEFDATAGEDYTLETCYLSESADTVISLYEANCTTLIGSDDDSGPGLGSRISWHCVETGTYRMRIDEKHGGTGDYEVLLSLEAEEAWLSFQHDNQNTGRTTHLGPQTPALNWTYQTGDWVVCSAVIDSLGRAYIGSDSNYLYAIESDGTVAWSYNSGGVVRSSVAIDRDGNVCLSESGRYLTKLSHQGSPVWSYEGCRSGSSPVIDDDGSIYFGSVLDEKIASVASDGSFRWSYYLGSDAYSHPCLDADGHVYIGSDGGQVFSFNTDDGSVNWSYDTGYAVHGGISVDSTGRLLFGDHSCTINCLDAEGALVWSYVTELYVSSTPAIGLDDSVYVGTVDGLLYAIDSSGSLMWSRDVGASIWGSAVIDGSGNIYFGADDNCLHCLSPDGVSLWMWETYGDVDSAPAICPDGSVVFGSWDGGIYSLTESDNQCPTLSGEDVSPPYGKSGATFTYSIYCLDQDSDGIASSEVVVDDAGYDMTLNSGLATDGTYTFATDALEEGDHEYYFLFEDTDGCSKRYPASGVFSGPTVDDTAPWSCCTAPYGASSATIAVNYQAGDDGGCGLFRTDLYYKFGEGGDWTYYDGVEDDAGTGTFEFLSSDGEGTYYFQTIAEDIVGNREAGPSGDGDDSTIYDLTKPSSSCTSPEQANSSPIPISFTASDEGSGVGQVALFYSFEGQGWIDSGVASAETEGTLGFDPPHGDGHYALYTIATDVAGNVENAPGSADDATLYDTAAPISSCTSAHYANSSPIAVDFTATDTGVASGVALVALYYNYEAQGWADSGLSASDASSGTLEFSPESGDGTYQFYTIATDRAGNVETAPTTADSWTVYDTAAPQSHCTSPQYADASPVRITLFADDADSGVTEVVLFYNYEDAGWTDSGVKASGGATETTVNFAPPFGDGEYEFYTIATDVAGNEEAAPGSADDATVFDTEAPVSSCLAPQHANSSPIEIGLVASDAASGVDTVYLWFNYNGQGWTDSGVNVQVGQEATQTTVSFEPADGDGTYEFYTLSTDLAGNVEAPPEGADSATSYDTVAPESSCTAPEYSTDATIVLSFVVSDALSADRTDYSPPYHVSLWYNCNDQAWAEAIAAANITEGTISFTVDAGEGTYGFYTIATDLAGNVEAPPATADATTVYDTTPPQSSCSSPQYASKSPFVVHVAGSDALSGVRSIALWYNYEGEGWTDSGLSTATGVTEGTLKFSPHDGDGGYDLYTIATDAAGNVESPPVLVDSTTVYDGTPPSSSCSGPSFANASPIAISFTAEGDVSGISQVALWFNHDDEGWTDTGSTKTGASGSFSFAPPEGDGSYEFYTIATDKAGNVETAPSAADDSTVYDTTAPSSSCTSPAFSNSTVIEVEFTANGAVSGIDEVSLWFNYGEEGWTDSGLTQAGTSGSFEFTPSDGEGSYEFYTIATDKAGNVEAAPSKADDATVHDTTAPVSSCTSPNISKTSPIAISFTANGGLSGVEEVSLWYKRGSGSWTDSELTQTGTSGSFNFAPPYGDGTYYFYTIATDTAGNVEAAPSKADDSTVYDATAPKSAANAPPSSESAPFDVEFSASDTTSGVDETSLWYRFGGGTWGAWGDPLTGTSGSFAFDAPDGEGTYEFYTISTDVAGNVEAAPGYADATTVYQVPKPDISVSTDEIDFGEVPVGGSRSSSLDAGPQTLTVSNLGEADLIIDDISTSADAFGASFEATLPITVEPEGTLAVEVSFAPETVGSYDEELVISSNDPDSPTVQVRLLGEGTAAGVLEVEVLTNAAAYEFGDTLELDVSVINTGAPVTVDIYLVLTYDLGGADERSWSASVLTTWTEDIWPLVAGVEIGSGFDLSLPWWSSLLPSEMPMVAKSGTYTFRMAAVEPGTLNLVSNYATAQFVLAGQPFVDVSTDRQTYSLTADAVVMGLDVSLPSHSMVADYYLVMMDPSGAFWTPMSFGEDVAWVPNPYPLLTSWETIPGWSLDLDAITMNLPSTEPFSASGQYFMFTAFVEPGTLTPFSDIGTASFALE